MKQLRNAKIITIIFHGFITIIAGHGMIVMCISDVIFPYLLTTGELQFNFSLQHHSIKLIPWAMLCSFVGKAIIIASLFVSQKSWKYWLTIFGLILLPLSFGCILLSNEGSFFIISLLSGIPFALYFVWMVYLLYCSRETV
ncbi:hypothetical protein [Kordia sp.]|uniref:hypothetical protein n=1 Tax=Kordia sp. TaxID=1965332 RepID=UPI003D6B5162